MRLARPPARYVVDGRSRVTRLRFIHARLAVEARRWGAEVLYGPGSTALLRSQGVPTVVCVQNPHLFGVDVPRSLSLAVQGPVAKDPAPLVASEALIAGRSLVLGPGIGNSDDLRRLSPEAVSVMATASASELIRSVSKLLGRVVTPGCLRRVHPELLCRCAPEEHPDRCLPKRRRSGSPSPNHKEAELSEGGHEVLPIDTSPHLGSHQVLRADRARLASSDSLGTSTEHRDGRT